MPQRTVLNITIAAATTNGIGASQTPAGAGNLTLAGSLTSGGTYTALDAAHQITIVTGADESAHSFTITGTDADGLAQTETMTGPNNTTGTSVNYYKTVTQISTNGAAGAALTVGTKSSIQTPTIQVNTRTSSVQITNAVIVTGTINYTLASTYDRIMNTPDINGQVTLYSQKATYINDPTIVTKTASYAALLATPAVAEKLTVNSYTSTPTIRWTIVEGYEQ